MKVNLRVAQMADADGITALFTACYPTLMAPAYDPDVLEKALPAMTTANPALIASGRFYVVEGDGRILGAGGWGPAPRMGEQVPIHIRHFATHPDATGQGVGSLCLEQCQAEARAVGHDMMGCFSSLNAEGFYARHGFERLVARSIPIGDATFPVIEMRCAL
jgi:GNAT superfamily N-acetyltransferase